MRKNPEFEELFDDDFEVTYEEYVPNEYRSSNDIYNDYDDDDDYYDDDYDDYDYNSNGRDSKKKKRNVMMKTVTMITPIPMTVPKRKNEEKILKYLWLHLSEKEDVSFPTFPLL
mgnify:CR=1 FL=1